MVPDELHLAKLAPALLSVVIWKLQHTIVTTKSLKQLHGWQIVTLSRVHPFWWWGAERKSGWDPRHR
jgi:predicted MPP superfamily phosphohydrolase